MINEDLLQYLWQYQLFDKNHLETVGGFPLRILKQGILNPNSGPDFENVRIVIGQIEWAGKVELHVSSSDWTKHKHQNDPAYENVVLHVVWTKDQAIFRKDGTEIPTLALADKTHPELVHKYKNLKESQLSIPCENLFPAQNELSKTSMIEKALARRLERKAAEAILLYQELHHNFEELAYRMLMKNFGFKLNAEPFLRLAQNLPQKILAKHRGNELQIEALLFGQAGFLDNPMDEYSKKLSSEYQFLASKYDLASSKLTRADWRFLRTRPQNFPTVRLAQVAAILNQTSALFSLFIESENLEFNPKLSSYWQHHYDWGKQTSKGNHLGKDSLNNIMINTVAPLLAAYYQISDDYSYFEKALGVLEKVEPEKNFITRIWQSLGKKCSSAFDSQGLIEQYNEYCTQKKCLSCVIGVEILKS